MLFKNPVLWWKFEGRYYHKDLYRGLRNLILWLPIIWRDRDWDSCYIFSILEHKIKLQAKGISKRDIHVRAQRDSEVMLTCARLINKVREGYYESEYFDFYTSEHSFEKVEDESESEFYTIDENIEEERFDEYFKKYPIIHERVLRGEGMFDINSDEDSVEDSEVKRKQRIAMNIATINQDRAKKLLFKIMEENVESWWD